MSRTDKTLMAVCVLTAAVTFFVVVIALSYSNRLSDRSTNLTNCRDISVPASRDAADRDGDLIEFARAAASARRADGQTKTAEHYDRIANRAQRREDRTQLRAAIPCSERFPKPSLFSF